MGPYGNPGLASMGAGPSHCVEHDMDFALSGEKLWGELAIYECPKCRERRLLQGTAESA